VRYLPLTLALLTAPFLPSFGLAADNQSPNFTGAWQLDTAKSQTAHDRNITLDIQDTSNDITFVRHVQEKDGKEIVSRFSCTANGQSCDFDEGGHKAKVSVWHDGPSLYVLKTNGPREDSTTEWQLQLSPDGKTLNVQFTLMEPAEKAETHIFNKTS
jgi:hypothetical protein